ncbi:TPA: glycosyltransferase family 4 protein [Enterobacter roggenkampii]
MMKRILFVTARYPWPIITGDALRAYNQIKELSKDNLVDVFSVERANSSSGSVNSFINLSDSGGLSKLDKIKNIIINRGKTALQCAMYNDRKSWGKLRDLLIANDYDIIIFQLVRLEYLIFKTISLRQEHCIKALIYCDFVDALSLNMQNRAATENFFMKKICDFESKKLSVVENKIYEAIDAGFIISERDANYIGKNDFKIIPNGVSIPVIHRNFKSSDGIINLAFWGNMSYYPNVKAAIFIANLFNDLPKGKYKLHIVGAQPCKQVMALNKPNEIIIHGYVDDLKNLLANMDIAVFPIFDGSGLQNKVLEAFALGLPVITTNIVLDSMPKLSEYAMVANSKSEFIRAIELFEPTEEGINKNSLCAIEVLKKDYNWNLINCVTGMK